MTHDDARMMHAEHLYDGTPLLHILRAPFIAPWLLLVYDWGMLKK